VSLDAAGNLYIGDAGNFRIRKVPPNGSLQTLVGNGKEGYSGDGGPATSAEISNPAGMAVDSAGNLYFADFVANVVRKVAPNGTISTVAGNGSPASSGDGGPAVNATLNGPFDVALDAAGNLYIADYFNCEIRKVIPAGTISTVAGIGVCGYSGDGGPATSAQLRGPVAVIVDAAGNLYISDHYNYRVRKVLADGIIITVAGSGNLGYSGDGGSAAGAALSQPFGLALDTAGNLHIADFDNNRVRVVNSQGIITTEAGNGRSGFAGDGGSATSASLNGPVGIAVDPSGNLYIGDSGNNRIRKVTLASPTNLQISPLTLSFTSSLGSRAPSPLDDLPCRRRSHVLYDVGCQ
jgi:sugar lactone lactonase YvrE